MVPIKSKIAFTSTAIVSFADNFIALFLFLFLIIWCRKQNLNDFIITGCIIVFAHAKYIKIDKWKAFVCVCVCALIFEFKTINNFLICWIHNNAACGVFVCLMVAFNPAITQRIDVKNQKKIEKKTKLGWTFRPYLNNNRSVKILIRKFWWWGGGRRKNIEMENWLQLKQ